MLLHFSEDRKVQWYNEFISEEAAQTCLSPNTLWLKAELPPEPEKREGFLPYLLFTEKGELVYEYEPEPEPIYTEMQILMQAIADLELTMMEGGMGNV